MIMSRIWTGILAVSLLCSMYNRCVDSLAASILQGAQSGVELAVSMAGAICLWSGVGKLMDSSGITDKLSKLLQPMLHRFFPSTAASVSLSRSLSSNICANILGLGNAATPMGIQAAKALKKDDTATDELCRLVVLNTASIQLIPASVAAVRSGLGCETPFDILPCVWLTSLCSAGLGLTAAWILGKLWKYD
jgi:spore maturation protein A